MVALAQGRNSLGCDGGSFGDEVQRFDSLIGNWSALGVDFDANLSGPILGMMIRF